MAWIEKTKKKRRPAIETGKRKERRKVYNRSAWQNLRSWKLQQDPLCEKCLERGVITPGEDVHHIRSFMKATDLAERDELAYDPENLMTLCKRCHQEIHSKG